MRTVDNIGIEAFSIARNEEKEEELEVYGRVANYGNSKADVTLSLHVNGQLLDATEKSIEAGKDVGIDFELRADSTDLGVFKLTIDALTSCSTTMWLTLACVRAALSKYW